jgi:hypothetical protein
MAPPPLGRAGRVMKQTPQEQRIYANFLPGEITKEGFLGEDTRHIHAIIEEDQRALEGLGITREQIADRLQYFIEEGKKGLESLVDLGNFTTQIRWSRGMLPSPFGDPKRLYHKIVATVFNKTLQQEIRYTQLNVQMIRDHGFFEGKGSVFRLDPEEVVRVLDIHPEPPASE